MMVPGLASRSIQVLQRYCTTYCYLMFQYCCSRLFLSAGALLQTKARPLSPLVNAAGSQAGGILYHASSPHGAQIWLITCIQPLLQT